MTMSVAQATAIFDTIAQSLQDTEAFLIPTSGNLTTIQNGMNGGTNSLISRVAPLLNDAQSGTLGNAAAGVSTVVQNTANLTKAKLYTLYIPMLQSLELSLPGGVAEFCRANSILVHPEFAACVNAFAASQGESGLEGVLLAPNIFLGAEQSLATFAVTGASAGTFAAGTALDLTKYAPAPLSLKNTTKVISPASGPTVAAAAGSTAFGAGSWNVAFSFTTPAGETLPSPLTATTLTSGQQLNVSAVTVPANATGVNYYVSISVGSTTLGLVASSASGAAISLTVAGGSTRPAAANTAFAASLGTATALTITYTNAAGSSSASVVGTLSGALAANALLSLATSGSAASAVTVTSGVAGDSFAITAEPLRVTTY